jgi:hypothetical protein
MFTNSENRKRINWIALFIVLSGFIIGVRDAVFRDLWFDEALTIGEFMQLPTIGAVYRQYVIPNNHIIYTVCLKIWNQLYFSFCSPDLYWRLFTVLTSAVLTIVIFTRWRKRYGTLPVVLLLFAFCLSLPFAIYATAVRGYMLSMLWIVVSYEFARSWVNHANWQNATGYFIFSLLAVGTIPSNLLALGAIVILLFPRFGFKRVLDWKFIFLALVPLAAAALFYLPLSDRVAAIMKLREGWWNAWSVARVVYSSFIIAFLPLLIASLAGAVVFLKCRKNRKYLWGLLVILMPLAVVFLRSPSPFPRVFLCLWPVWMLMTVAGLAHLTASVQKRKHRLVLVLILLVASFGWAKLCSANRDSLADMFHDKSNMDDFFNPYYMAPEYKPWSLIKNIQKLSGDKNIPVYITFTAEPCVILLYGRMAGIDPRLWLFDRPPPFGKVQFLPRPAWILLKQNELKGNELEKICKRFDIDTKNVNPIFSNEVYAIFEAAK